MKKLVFAVVAATMFPFFAFASDRDALELLYDALSGDQWDNADGWLSEAPLDEWHGIVTRNGRVISIELPGNNLIGQLPSGLDDLDELEVLDLRWNYIWGSIPESIGEMAKLESFLLTGNELSGEIPWSIGSIQTLKRLDLSNNQLSGAIPGALGELQSLEALGLQHNHLTGEVPRELTRIRTMRRIMLNNNNLTGTVPFGSGQFGSGTHIRIDSNPMTFDSFPSMDRMTLEERDLSAFDQISGEDLLDETTIVLGDNQAAEFVRSTLSALFVQDGYLRFEPTKLPRNVTVEQFQEVIDEINHGLRESGDRIHSVDDLERTLELYDGRSTIAIPDVVNDVFSFEAAPPQSSFGTSTSTSISISTSADAGAGASTSAVAMQSNSETGGGGSDNTIFRVVCDPNETKAHYPHQSYTNNRQITGKASAECEYVEGPPQSLTYTAIVRVQKRDYIWGIFPYYFTVGQRTRSKTGDPMRFTQSELVAVADCINGIYRTLFSLHLRGSVSGTDFVPYNPAYHQSPLRGINTC